MNFYPAIKDFLTESKPAPDGVPAIRIEDVKKVQAADGEWIDMDELNFEMESAKTAIVGQSPLFGPFIHEMRPIYTWIVPTMATDGTRLFVNPQFANNLSWEQKIFVILHEIMHCVLSHPDRLAGRDKEKSNYAMDYEVNSLLVDTISDFNEKFINDISGLYEKMYTNWGFEQIYLDQESKGWPQVPPPPPPAPPGAPPKSSGSGKPQISVGDKVKIKSSGKSAVVTSINADGTFEVDMINENFIQSIFEGFTRDEIVPLKSKPSQNSQGQGPPTSSNPDDDTEYEDGGEENGGEGNGEGEEGDGKDQQKPNNGNNAGSGKAIDRNGKEIDGVGGAEHGQITGDPGKTGKVITPQQGKEIAKKSGATGQDIEDDFSSKKWADAAREIASTIKGQKNTGSPGTGSGQTLAKRISEIYGSLVKWKKQLKRYIGLALSPEYESAWAKKKWIQQGIYLPKDREKTDAISNIIIAIDTSGSMGEDTLKEIMREVNGILKAKRAKKVTILYFDTAVHHVETLTGAQLSKTYKKLINSSAGTDHNAVTNYIKKNFNNKVNLLIFMTDDDARYVTPAKPRYAKKIIWLLYDSNDKKPMPYGKTIFLDMD